MGNVADFLDRFRRADAEGDLLRLFIDDFEDLGAAIDAAPDALLAVAHAAVSGSGAPADLHPDSFASAACARDGAIVVADAGFAGWLAGADPLEAVVRRINPGRPSVSAIADDRTGRPVALAAASLALARNWPLADNVRAALEAGRAAYAVIGFRPGDRAWDRAARASRLTPAQARITVALVRHGTLRDAARATGISYETARKLIADAMRRTGTARQTDLLRLFLSAAAGELRPPEGAERIFADLFGLTLRQSQLAREIASGATRDAASSAHGSSEHRSKADLKIVYQACGVANAADLARIVAEVDALAGLAAACSIELLAPGAEPEPLRLVTRRRAPGRIAVADHGPANVRPVILFHTAVAGRQQPRAFIAALQQAGFRPIVFERAGFGLSDAVEGDPYAAAAADLADVLDDLGLAQVLVLARSGSTAALTCAATLRDRISGGVLVGPDPPVDLDRRRGGMMGHAKSLFFGNRAVATAFAQILSRRTSSAMIERLMRESVRGSAVDEAALDAPGVMADIVRAGRQSALGMHGFLSEMIAHGSGIRPPQLPDATRWVVLSGANDPLYATAETEAFWRQTLPGARFDCVADGGRFLHLTHPARVIAALEACAPD